MRFARRGSAGLCATTIRVMGTLSMRSAIALLGGLVQVCRALVEEDDARITIESARKQHALALATRQCRAHVADQAEILHRRAHDVVVNLRHPGCIVHLSHVEIGIKESDVVGSGARQQSVVLCDNAYPGASCTP
jgi:hypothetical protein